MTAIPKVLAGGRALVTGAGKRLGRAIALELGRRGMWVAVHYGQSAAAAEETCAAIATEGGVAFALPADLRDRAATRLLVDRAVDRLGGLDLLVVSAAGFERVAFDAIDDRAWDQMVELDLTSPFVLAQRATPSLRRARGSIVFLTCTSALAPYRHHLPYVVAKGGLSQLTRALALELAPDVRVNAVAPGTVLPPDTMGDDERARMARMLPLGRLGTADDIARAVLFLAESPFITGTEIQVDGGRALARIEPST
ncbi:MAG: SDR family oxidoreductase [Polyangiaceae bacterium]|nr:SDR family oxidoreductase [Polyangiaceae bacterium]